MLIPHSLYTVKKNSMKTIFIRSIRVRDRIIERCNFSSTIAIQCDVTIHHSLNAWHGNVQILFLTDPWEKIWEIYSKIYSKRVCNDQTLDKKMYKGLVMLIVNMIIVFVCVTRVSKRIPFQQRESILVTTITLFMTDKNFPVSKKCYFFEHFNK